MATRVLLGIVAALRAVLIPGDADRLLSQPLRWPPPRLKRAALAAPPTVSQHQPPAPTAVEAI
jgi:hypothetical protein